MTEINEPQAKKLIEFKNALIFNLVLTKRERRKIMFFSSF